MCERERERDRERERERVCVRERECVCVRERESVCVCVCVCVRESVCRTGVVISVRSGSLDTVSFRIGRIRVFICTICLQMGQLMAPSHVP